MISEKGPELARKLTRNFKHVDSKRFIAGSVRVQVPLPAHFPEVKKIKASGIFLLILRGFWDFLRWQKTKYFSRFGNGFRAKVDTKLKRELS